MQVVTEIEKKMENPSEKFSKYHLSSDVTNLSRNLPPPPPPQSIGSKGKTAAHLSKAWWLRQLVLSGFENPGSEARRLGGSEARRLGGSESGSSTQVQRTGFGLRHGKTGLEAGLGYEKVRLEGRARRLDNNHTPSKQTA